MQRRKFLNGSLTIAGVGLAGCLGGDDEEEQCLPEDESEFYQMNEDQVRSWAPQGSGFDIRIQRNPSRPEADIRHERTEEDPTHWLDLTYSDANDDDAVYQLTTRLFQEEQYAEADGATAETTRIPHHDQRVGLVDANTAISGYRGRFSYHVWAEGDGREDRAEELFLMIPCVEEEHIQDSTG